MDLSGPLTKTKTILDLLERFGWVDRFSRAVFADVNVFNPNVNLFTRYFCVSVVNRFF